MFRPSPRAMDFLRVPGVAEAVGVYTASKNPRTRHALHTALVAAGMTRKPERDDFVRSCTSWRRFGSENYMPGDWVSRRRRDKGDDL